jgi:hypothetical protein
MALRLGSIGGNMADYARESISTVEVNYKYLIGVYRMMWMEHLQSKGIENPNALTLGSPANWPRSIYYMRNILEDAIGMPRHQYWLNDIFTQYREGLRA